MKRFILPILMLMVSLEQTQPVQVGDRFPELTGHSLAGQQVTFPTATAGQVAIVSVGYLLESQAVIDTWVKPLSQKLSGLSGQVFYEVPVMAGMLAIGRWYVNTGMRMGIPEVMHPFVVCYYGDQEAYRARLGTPSLKYATLFVLDPQGVIRYIGHGTATPIRLVEVEALVRQLVHEAK